MARYIATDEDDKITKQLTNASIDFDEINAKLIHNVEQYLSLIHISEPTRPY